MRVSVLSLRQRMLVAARPGWWETCVVGLLVVLGGVACEQDVITEEVGDEEEPTGPTYRNPVLDRDFPDPAVLEGPDGAYYTYATETVVNGQFYNIQVARSSDLVNWSWAGDAFPEGVTWAENGRSYWAPHVVYDGGQSRYLMYYSAHHDQNDEKCLSVAVADSPLGPFSDEREPLRCEEGFAAIDPMVFEDPKSDSTYLYWGSHGEPIRVQLLADDWTDFARGTRPRPVLHPDPDEPYGSLIEGAWVTYRDGRYYLFFSGDNCCGEQAHYAVMVARAEHPTGPFEMLGEVRGTGRSTIVTANQTWLAPGHNSVVRDAAGTDWMLYHAIDRDHPTQANGWDRRVMLMDPLVYENGWPRIDGAQPSEHAPVPVVEDDT